MDYLSEVVFFCDLYCNGMGMRGSVRDAAADASGAGIFVAAGGRDYLYGWRYYLCAEAANF